MESPTHPELPAVLTDRVAFLLQLALRQAQEMGERSLVELELSGREYGVLALLATGTPTAQHRLGSALGVDRTTTVALLSRLEQRGLVRRARQPDDRRAYAVSLTNEGDALRQQAAQVLAVCDEQFLQPLAPRDRGHLREMLTRLTGSG